MVIKNNIKQLRKCFDEEVIHNYNDDALSWMLFVDGCATLKFIDSIVEKNVKKFQIKYVQVAFVQQDLFLLENQLPYQILNDLIQISNESENLRKLVQSFIDMQSMTVKKKENPSNKEPVHLLDLLRNRLLDCTSKSPENNSTRKIGIHFAMCRSLKQFTFLLSNSHVRLNKSVWTIYLILNLM